MPFHQVVECWNWCWKVNLCFLFSFQLQSIFKGCLNSKETKLQKKLEGAKLGRSQETTTTKSFQPISTFDGLPKWHDTRIRLIEWHLNTSSMYGFDCSTVEYILEAGFCMCHMFRFVAKRCVMMSYNAFHKGWPNCQYYWTEQQNKLPFLIYFVTQRHKHCMMLHYSY